VQAILPVILSGGSGTRLWPLSRRLYPKQFMDLGGDTLFGTTVHRSLALPGSRPPMVICNEEQRFLAAAILQEHGLNDPRRPARKAAILLEPEGRNTAPAVALAALAALGAYPDEDPIVLVLASDHVIEPLNAFVEAVGLACAGADSGRLVVFGVPPAKPETGFGYIHQGETLFPGVYAVDRFVEKPDAASAAAMLRAGDYTWNSGMFMFRASVFLEELARHAPEVEAACRAIWQTRRKDLDFIRFDGEAFAACPSISVDYAVMEKTDKACMTPLNADWSDMGSWESFYESAPKDEAGNALSGDVLTVDSKNCYLRAGSRMLAVLGLEDICLVETADAVLALPRARSQEVKALLERMKREKRPETDVHSKVYRPWGSYETLVLGERFQVKRIIVNPGGKLSLQRHYHRAEHWVVVRGVARIAKGEVEEMLQEDMSVYIPQGTTHRLDNPGRIPLELIEIQTGSYLGEDDIERFDDTYGRVAGKQN
jgi:mannose-1-phosphate guanylyltransferase/mannose-6-phosphate isomerase